jgi:hypothetical protein
MSSRIRVTSTCTSATLPTMRDPAHGAAVRVGTFEEQIVVFGARPMR